MKSPSAGNLGRQGVRRVEPAPLSFDQERLWLFDRLFPSALATDRPTVIRLSGELNLAAFGDAVREVIARHESLRTRFPVTDGIPSQVVDDPPAGRLCVVDLTALAEDRREPELAAIIDDEARRPYDLEKGPVFRVTMVRLGAGDHVVVTGMHHMAADLWSVAIVGADLSALYGACLAGEPAALPKPAFQQVDHALWQRDRLGGRRAAANRGYWRQRLNGARALDLPTDRPRPRRPNLTCLALRDRFESGLSDRIRQFSQAEGVTLFVTLLAAWDALLAAWSRQYDVVTISVSAGRSRPGMTRVAGMFTENLVVRCDLGGDPTFRALLARVKEAVFDAFDHRETPFAHIVADLDPRRDLEPSPLRQIGFSLHNVPSPAPVFDGLEIGSVNGDGELELERSEADAWLDVFDVGSGPLAIRLQMDNVLFEPETPARIVRWLTSLAAAAIALPGARISTLLPSGLGDRRAEHDAARVAPSTACRPSRAIATATERAVVGMFEALLGVAGVTADDNFFRLGGDSLAASRMVARIEARFGVVLSLYEFMTAPTAAEVAGMIDADRRTIVHDKSRVIAAGGVGENVACRR